MAGIAALLLAAIAVFAWRTTNRASSVAAAPQKGAVPAASLIPEHSIAVLPFADLSERKDQEYISDGLAEALLDLLSKVPGMQVAARTSAFSFKGRDRDVPVIGRQLLVAHVLEGAADITIAGRPISVSEGELVLMPANQPHAVHARTRFKMLLTMIRPEAAGS